MAKEEKPQAYKTFIEGMDKLDGVLTLEKGAKDPRSEVREKAFKRLQKIAYEAIPEGNRPESSDKITDPTKYVNFHKSNLQVGAADTLSKNLDTILDKEMPAKTLEQMAVTGEVASKISRKAQPVIDSLREYLVWQAVSKAYEGKETLSSGVQKRVQQAAIVGAGETAAEEAKKNGKSETVQNGARVIAQLAMKQFYTPDKAEKYAKAGFKKIIEETKKGYDNSAKKYKVDVHAEIRNAYKALAKEDFGKAFSIAYAAEKGKISLLPSDSAPQESDEMEEAA